MSEDLAAILENDVLTYLRVIGLFLVLGVALFNFTESGKSFSLIALIIFLILLIVITFEYFKERNKIIELGFFPRKVIDILMFTMIGVIILTCWIIYEVWNTEQTSLLKLTQDIDTKVQEISTIDLEILKREINSSNKQSGVGQEQGQELGLGQKQGQELGLEQKQRQERQNLINKNTIKNIKEKFQKVNKIQEAENKRNIINTSLLASVS